MIMKAVIFAILATTALADLLSVSSPSTARDLLKMKCEMHGAADKLHEVERIVTVKFMDCVTDKVDIGRLMSDFQADMSGDLVRANLSRYCEKMSLLKPCIHMLLEGQAPCLDNRERTHLPKAIKATDDLIDYSCYNDGSRIVEFVIEEGPECIQSKQLDLMACFTAQSDASMSIEEALNLSYAERCAKFDAMKNCIMRQLRTCGSPKAANLADTAMSFIRKTVPCKN